MPRRRSSGFSVDNPDSHDSVEPAKPTTRSSAPTAPPPSADPDSRQERYRRKQFAARASELCALKERFHVEQVRLKADIFSSLNSSLEKIHPDRADVRLSQKLAKNMELNEEIMEFVISGNGDTEELREALGRIPGIKVENAYPISKIIISLERFQHHLLESEHEQEPLTVGRPVSGQGIPASVKRDIRREVISTIDVPTVRRGPRR